MPEARALHISNKVSGLLLVQELFCSWSVQPSRSGKPSLLGKDKEEFPSCRGFGVADVRPRDAAGRTGGGGDRLQDTARTDKLQLGGESNPALLALWRQFRPLGHTTPGFNEVLDHSADSSPFITFYSRKPACVFSLVLFSPCACSQFGWNHPLWQCRAAEKEEVEKGVSLSVCVCARVCARVCLWRSEAWRRSTPWSSQTLVTPNFFLARYAPTLDARLHR